MPDEAPTDGAGDIIYPEPKDQSVDASEQVEATESTDEESPPDDSEVRQLWADRVPEMADEFDNLSATQRVKILLSREPAQTRQSATTEASEDASTNRRNAPSADSPSLEQVMSPQARKALRDAIDEGNGQVAEQLMAERDQAIMATVAVSHDSLDRRIDAPRKLRQALPAVSGASSKDLDRAEQILASGDVANARSALKLAAFDRLQGQQKTAQTTEGATTKRAKRTAAAIAADTQGRGAPPKGVVVTEMPTDFEGLQEVMGREQQQQ